MQLHAEVPEVPPHPGLLRGISTENMSPSPQGIPTGDIRSNLSQTSRKTPKSGQPDAFIFAWYPMKFQGLLPQPED